MISLSTPATKKATASGTAWNVSVEPGSAALVSNAKTESVLGRSSRLGPDIGNRYSDAASTATQVPTGTTSQLPVCAKAVHSAPG
jgi:hypothetical protein